MNLITLSFREYQWSAVSERSREERGICISPRNSFLLNLSQSHTFNQRVRDPTSEAGTMYYVQIDILETVKLHNVAS